MAQLIPSALAPPRPSIPPLPGHTSSRRATALGTRPRLSPTGAANTARHRHYRTIISLPSSLSSDGKLRARNSLLYYACSVCCTSQRCRPPSLTSEENVREPTRVPVQIPVHRLNLTVLLHCCVRGVPSTARARTATPYDSEVPCTSNTGGCNPHQPYSHPAPFHQSLQAASRTQDTRGEKRKPKLSPGKRAR